MQINHLLVRKKGSYSDKIVQPLLPQHVLRSHKIKQPYFYASNYFPLWIHAGTNKIACTMIRNGRLLPPSAKVKYGIPTSLQANGDQWDYPYA